MGPRRHTSGVDAPVPARPLISSRDVAGLPPKAARQRLYRLLRTYMVQHGAVRLSSRILARAGRILEQLHADHPYRITPAGADSFLLESLSRDP